MLPGWRGHTVSVVVAAVLLVVSAAPIASARDVARVEISSGLVATFDEGDLFLAASPERGEGLLAFSRRLTGSEKQAGVIASANGGSRKLQIGVRYKVPWKVLRPEYQVRVLRAIFGDDRPTATGWEHRVLAAEVLAGRSLERIAEWFTGSSINAPELARHNGLAGSQLGMGQVIVIPPLLLKAQLRSQLPKVAPAASAELSFDRDDQGEFAVYHLKSGEALYSSVVVRFTGNVYADDVNALAAEVAQRSQIADVTDIPVGFGVKIPLDLLLPEFLPETHPRRLEYEESVVASSEFAVLPRLSHLQGVTIILDAGHGGADVGASKNGVWESLYVYDIMLRTKKLLEENTAASVVATTRDGGSFRIDPRDVLPYSRGHSVLTTPNYKIEEATVSAHLRWYLANSIFRVGSRHGSDPTKTLFLSIHADSLHPSLRGAMAYIPGADYRTGTYGKSGNVYASRKEVREEPQVSFSRNNRVQSEGLSRELAQQLISAFHHQGLAVHEFKPIREKIIRNRRSFVPAVLRYNAVPAKALFEVCNLANPEDLRLIQTQRQRQRIAEALVRGILAYYGDELSVPGVRVTAGS
jgi:N-acetylmuramoyl-L-alanine amidase